LIGATTLVAGAGAAAQQDDGAAYTDAGQSSRVHAPPAGYLGITFTCKLKSKWGPSGLAITHYGYPAVALVAPDSPAERAGIEPGDTIVAYDDQDVRNRPIVLNKLLQPNTRLGIRLRRNGQLRDVAVLITRRPVAFVELPDMRGAAEAPDAAMPPMPPDPPAGAGAAPASVPSAMAWSRPLLRSSFGSDDSEFGELDGAEVVRTTRDLREALGVSEGLLVVAIQPGTPAAEADLRAGDIIQSADGLPVTSPSRLARVIERGVAASHNVTLQVERQHRVRHVVLQW